VRWSVLVHDQHHHATASYVDHEWGQALHQPVSRVWPVVASTAAGLLRRLRLTFPSPASLLDGVGFRSQSSREVYLIPGLRKGG